MDVNSLLTYFILTVVFSFLIGLELKAYKMKFHVDDSRMFLGTTRTYTFIGIIGFIFYIIEPNNFSVYIVGFLAITLLFSMLYYKLLDYRSSIVLYLVAAIVYSFGPLINLFPIWLSSLIFVITIFVLNIKKRFESFNLKINIYEMETLGKMILLSAVVLPLLPEDTNIPYLGISLYKIWLVVVVVSAISYAGYLVQKYLFPSKGIFLTGILGGLYSSTATTVVLSRKSRGLAKNHLMTASIIIATSMMYLRLIVIAYIFNVQVANSVLIPFLSLAIFSALITFVYYKKATNSESSVEAIKDSNPLELGTAFVFTFLFVIMMFITNFAIGHYGTTGLKFLALIVGLTDADPFVLSLLTGKYTIDQSSITGAIVIASGSNNILKAIVTIWFGKEKTLESCVWLIILAILAISIGFII